MNSRSSGQANQNPDWARDELILALELYLRYGRKPLDRTHADVIALSEYLNVLPLHPLESRRSDFRNPSGVAMKLGNLRAVDPTRSTLGLPRASRADVAVMNEFGSQPERVSHIADAIREAVREYGYRLRYVETGGLEFAEGILLTRRHMLRDREALRETDKGPSHARSVCECCSFDFTRAYPSALGAACFDPHDLRPVVDARPSSHSRDVAILCSNCHRIVHSLHPPLTVAQLRAELYSASR